MAKTHIETLIEKYSRDDEFIVDSLLIEISAQIADAMQGEGLSQSQLAERLGITKSYVSRLLHGTKNMTIRTLC
ncbi:MAG TPA: helix-turn-helix transcriptional regulator, partial [Anaerolineae bacterium]